MNVKLPEWFIRRFNHAPGRLSSPTETRSLRIAIDGVIFQLQGKKSGGISVVWSNYLNRLSKSELSEKLIVLDRGRTTPRFDGLNYRRIKKYKGTSKDQRLQDSIYLEQLCGLEKVSLLISTYYTYADRTKTAIVLYDFIPERLGWDLNVTEWQSKHEAMQKAFAYISISENTLKDFRYYYPQFVGRSTQVIYNAAGEHFRPHSLDEVTHFQKKYGIIKPYYLFVGHRWPHKNAALFFQAAALMPDSEDFEILITGGNTKLEEEYVPWLKNIKHQVVHVSGQDMSPAYSGALALVYPSFYEGFGLPVLEAMQSACPVITSPNSSLLEIGDGSCLFVKEDDVQGMREALTAIRDSRVRERLIKAGLNTASKYSWETSSRTLIEYLYALSSPDSHASIKAP